MKKLLTIIILLLMIQPLIAQQSCYEYNHNRSKGNKLIGTVCVILLFTPVVLGIIDYQINKK